LRKNLIFLLPALANFCINEIGPTRKVLNIERFPFPLRLVAGRRTVLFCLLEYEYSPVNSQCPLQTEPPRLEAQPPSRSFSEFSSSKTLPAHLNPSLRSVLFPPSFWCRGDSLSANFNPSLGRDVLRLPKPQGRPSSSSIPLPIATSKRRPLLP